MFVFGVLCDVSMNIILVQYVVVSHIFFCSLCLYCLCDVCHICGLFSSLTLCVVPGSFINVNDCNMCLFNECIIMFLSLQC